MYVIADTHTHGQTKETHAPNAKCVYIHTPAPSLHISKPAILCSGVRMDGPTLIMRRHHRVFVCARARVSASECARARTCINTGSVPRLQASAVQADREPLHRAFAK